MHAWPPSCGPLETTYVAEHVAHEVHTAALPLRSQDLADGVLEARVVAGQSSPDPITSCS